MNNNSQNHNNNNNNIKTSFMSFDTNFYKTYLALLVSLFVHIDCTFLCLEFHPLSLWIDVFFAYDQMLSSIFLLNMALRTHEKLSLFWQLWFPHWGWRYHWLGNTLYQRRASGWFSGPFFSYCFISLFQNIFGPRKKINIQFLQYKSLCKICHR